MKFYGREMEIGELKRIREISHETSQFTVVTGRRRVGKTELVDKALNDGLEAYLYLFVSRRAEKDLCSIFQEEVQAVIDQPILGNAERFGQLLEMIMVYSMRKPLTLVIDEFQEFRRVNNSIFSDMQKIWDIHKTDAKINLILCGSIYHLMTELFVSTCYKNVHISFYLSLYIFS